MLWRLMKWRRVRKKRARQKKQKRNPGSRVRWQVEIRRKKTDTSKESEVYVGDKKMEERARTPVELNKPAISAKTEGNQAQSDKHTTAAGRPLPNNKRKVNFTNDERGNTKRQRAPPMADPRDRNRNVPRSHQDKRDNPRSRDQRFSRKRSRSPPPVLGKDTSVTNQHGPRDRSVHPSEASTRSQPSGPPARHRQRRGK
mmetsp:Transcript_4567/g.28955  ORF Transcript_4567/g.28955 Transcript_4567/m.28955 type:complete len:199 (+) Transcript_4567:3671-4267(+)